MGLEIYTPEEADKAHGCWKAAREAMIADDVPAYAALVRRHVREHMSRGESELIVEIANAIEDGLCCDDVVESRMRALKPRRR